MLRRKISERKRMSTAIVTEEHVTSPAKELDSKYLQDTLRYCIAQLPEHIRNVITLRDLAELSYLQISRILEISVGTARVYRCKALQMLTVLMSKEE
jgi:RNA polymerase sigma factor (sigma-70 family)